MGRNTVIILVLTLVLCACERRQSLPAMGDGVVCLPVTPVKDQGESRLGSLYAMLATIETEHLSQGDSVNLSAAFPVRAWLRERTLRYYLSQGAADMPAYCTAATAIHLLQAYGVYPYDTYESPAGFRQSVVERKLMVAADAAILRRVGVQSLSSRIDDVLDQSMGYLPGNNVHFLGADYTPTEFARSVCAPDEYLRLISFTHLPYGEVTEATTDIGMPDPMGYVETRNLPLDSLVTHVRRALEAGHAVCWEGDTTNQDFTRRQGHWVTIASHPLASDDERAYRQRAYERLGITLDHAFAIVGVGKRGGEVYFRCKNSQGEQWGDAGYVYLSESYLRRYTMAIIMSHAAFKAS